MLGAETTARANVNVALVKYWGKRDPVLNLPATGSISITPTMQYRAIYHDIDGINHWYWIGTHAEYKKFTGSPR